MATFSFGVAPGAPGTYINESVGNVAAAAIASFSTVYMLVETEETVSVTNFPYNKPMMVTSVADYKALVGGVIPDSGIPLLSYNCVNSFFQNAQVGDLRVVRVGTPNQIVEIEILASGTKISNSGIPSPLEAGDIVYAQLLLNNLKLVAGDGSTGYSSSGDWYGVPVTIPVDYIAGDTVNNRKISKAIADAISGAIESNPSVRSSVFVRDYGLLVDLDSTSTSENAFVSIAATTYGGSLSVVTQQNPVGSKSMLMNNTYDVQNIVGLEGNLVRVPQDYIQCISTAFDGQQDQGYLITPTAYAQFDTTGRAAVGAAAAAHCQSNDFKWMALADPGPFLITDVNKYSTYAPHLPADDLETGKKYLVDNAIYEWTGVDVSYDKLRYQAIIGGYDPKVAVQQSVEAVGAGEKVGAIDPGTFTLSSESPYAEDGKFIITSSSVWPAGLQIMEVNLSNKGADFASLGDQVYIVAPPYDSAQYGPYPSDGSTQIVYIATSATAASSVYNEVVSQGGSDLTSSAPVDCFSVSSPVGSTVEASYGTPSWDLGAQININGQSSNLIQNISDTESYYVNTTHIPGTLQDSTNDYRLGFVSRTLFNPQDVISSTTIGGNSYCLFTCDNHKLVNGQQVFFTRAIKYNSTTVFKATSQASVNPYYVKAIDLNTFVLASSYSNYLATSYVTYPGVITTVTPSVLYSKITGGELTAINLGELSTITMTRGRKFGLASGSIANTAYDTDEGAAQTPPSVSIYMNNSSVVLGNEQIFPYGEDINAGWQPTLELVNYGTSTTEIENFVCTPTVDQRYGSEAYLVPSIDAIYGGEYDPSMMNTTGPLETVGNLSTGAVAKPTGTYQNVAVSGGSGTGAKATVVVDGAQKVVSVTITDGGLNYSVSDTGLGLSDGSLYSGFTMDAATVMVPAGPLSSVTNLDAGAVSQAAGTYVDVEVTGGSGTGAKATVVVSGLNVVTSVVITTGGTGYEQGDTGLGLSGAGYSGFTMDVSEIASGYATSLSDYAIAAGVVDGVSGERLGDLKDTLLGVYFDVTADGLAPDGTQSVVSGDRVAVVYSGSTYSWAVVPADYLGGDMSSVAHVCYGAQVEISLTQEQAPPSILWRFDAITSTEIMDNALRGVGFNGEPQAVFIEAGVDNVNRLYEDSQRYFNAFGFIAYYGSYIYNASGQYIPPTPYVTGVAIRRYRAEGFQFPPAGVKYQLADAISVQIPVNSAQQNLLNPDGCNVVRTLPGYPDTSVFIWGGRTRVNSDVADQRKFQFVNTRVIQNVVYGSLRSAFDNQIFSIVDGFGVVFNQIVSIGNSVLGQLWSSGALFGARPSDAFQVICDNRINTSENLENGLVYVKVFDVPVPTLERIEVDLIRVSVGQMNKELESQGLS